MREDQCSKGAGNATNPFVTELNEAIQATRCCQYEEEHRVPEDVCPRCDVGMTAMFAAPSRVAWICPVKQQDERESSKNTSYGNGSRYAYLHLPTAKLSGRPRAIAHRDLGDSRLAVYSCAVRSNDELNAAT